MRTNSLQTRNFQAQPAPRCQQLRGVRQDHARHARRMLLPQRGLFLPETRATRSATLSCGAGRRVGTASGTPKQPCVGAGCQRAGSHSPLGVLHLLTLLTDSVALGCGRTVPDVGRTGGARRLGLCKHGRRASKLPTCMLLWCETASVSRSTSDLAGRSDSWSELPFLFFLRLSCALGQDPAGPSARVREPVLAH